ncbi:MAG: NUDIX domain-containing protein [Calditrichaeota bacterium]|nr:NUDIX domain-containing protein [Calditrichota bacterium]
MKKTDVPDYIRPVALGIFKKNDEILVFRGHDFHSNEDFYRPLGGGIEFGETGSKALKREIMEEMGAEIGNVEYLATLENIFSLNNQTGHEIVLVYRADFSEAEIYQRKKFQITEDDLEPYDACWKNLKEFETDEAILYPEGILEIIMRAD